MSRRDGIRNALLAAFVLTPALGLAQTPPNNNDPEPALDPLPAPGTRTPQIDRLPGLEPMPAPKPAVEDDDVPPARSIVRPPADPTPIRAGGEVIVEEGEPVVIQDDAPAVVVGPALPTQMAWVPGRFEKEADRLVTIPGRWEKPLIGAPRYIAAHTRRQPGKVVWVPGHWTKQAAPLVVSAPTTTVVARPPLDPGVTVAGQQVVVAPAAAVVVPGRKYVAGQWKQGLLGNWKYVPGRWLP